MSNMSESQLSSKLNQRHIDWGSGTVTNGGAAAATLRPQSLSVLKFLAERPGAVVTKDELMAAIWPGIAVTDDSLVQCVTEIRKALGDDAHMVIKTVPKRGYVFEAPAVSSPRRTPRSLWLKAAALAAFAAAIGFAVSLVRPADVTFAEKPAIAVLPFKNLGPDAKWNQLAAVMTEDVITDLSHSKEFLVIAQSSTASFKAGETDLRQIGRDLKVGYVLEGSVAPAGSHVRFNAALIDTATGTQIWSERYDRAADDMFAVEGEITQRIATTLTKHRGILKGAALQLAKRKPPNDMKAFDYYLLAGEQILLFTRESLRKAKLLLEQSIALDPSFARAYVYLAWVHNFNIMLGFADSLPEEQTAFIEAAGKAVSLDPNDGEAYLALGVAYSMVGDFGKSGPLLARAEELSPANADTLIIAASLWPWLGEPEHGARNADLASRLNPTYPAWYTRNFVDAYFYANMFDKALFHAPQVSNPVFYDLSIQTASLAYLGRMDEAKAAVAKLVALESEGSVEQTIHDFGGFAREQEAELLVNGVRKAGGPACMTPAALKARPQTLQLASCKAEREGK
jgi:TolB-like protein/DNA-binding winged helix-turn-helix (wHTH) protein